MRTNITILVAVLLLLLSSTAWTGDFVTGLDAYETGDYQAATTEWQPLAAAGDADGQFGMGLLYANGFGVPLDDAQALKWYRLAADQGHAEAQCNIAVMYANGWGVPQSDEEAFRWYSLAAEQGIGPAQVNLGQLYAGGFGVAEDHVQALKWFSVAAELGDDNAPEKRDYYATRVTAEQRAEAEGLANAWMAGHQSLLASH